MGTAEWPCPQWSDRFRTGYRNQAQREIARRRPRFSLGLVEQLAYGAKILDVAPAIGAVDKVAEGGVLDPRRSGPRRRTLIAIRRVQRTAPSSRRPRRLQTSQLGGRPQLRGNAVGNLAGLYLNP